jgi:hypothetical protein
MILFIDDEREFETVCGVRYRSLVGLRPFTTTEQDIIRTNRNSVHTARTYHEACMHLAENQYEMIFFDHDLGDGPNGKDVALHIAEKSYGPFEYYVHSANPVGRENIDCFLKQYMMVFFGKNK